MTRRQSFLTFLCIVTAVAALFFWYRNTTTAYDTVSLKLTNTCRLTLNAVDGRLYLYCETIIPPNARQDWRRASIVHGHSQWSYDHGTWDELKFHHFASFGAGRHVPAEHPLGWAATGVVVPMWFVALLATIYPVRRLIRRTQRHGDSK